MKQGPVNKMLVYIDGSEESITAAEYSVVLSKKMGAELYAIYVINTRALDDLVKSRIFLQIEEEEYKRDLESDADRYLNHVKELATKKGVAINLIKKSGNVHAELKKSVQENDIDLLVLGELAHVRSRRDEFYNEAERAMRIVDCSVMIVKDEEKVWELYEALE
ncbi:MAG: universal stress protein [Spirochaetes bacterium]|nr:MAG: universal stress protein [Spirochaetota bacterium]